MRAVNLLPRESHGRRPGGRRIDPLIAGGATLTAVVAAALAGGFVLEHSHAASAQQQLAAARAELTRLQAEARQGQSAKTSALPTPAVTQQQAPWDAALTSALSTRVPWDDVLAELARVVPSNVSLTTVSLGAPTGTTGAVPASGAAGTLDLGGSAFDETGVAQLLSRLALVPSLNSILLTSSTADPKTGHVSFALTAQVMGPLSSATVAPAGGVAS